MTQHVSLVVLALAVTVGACQPPPPVGRAANPTPPTLTRGGNQESAALLKQLDAMQKELAQRPKDHKVRMALGKLYYENERFLDAAVMFREALDTNPTDVDANKFLGNCLFFLGNPDMAVAQHDKVLAAAPNDIDALFFLGAILVESRPQDRAALKRAGDAWARFLELAPTHPRSKEIAEQLEVVRKAERGEITLGNPEAQAAQQQAQGGGADGEPQGGDQGVMGGTRSFDAPGGGAGGAPAGGGAGPGARKGTRVPALRADASPLEKSRAQALDALDERRFVDAQQAAKEALLLAPDDPEMQVARARAMVQLGQAADAVRAFGEVIKKNPKFAPAWHYLGMAHMMNNDPARAAQTWRDLMAMDPAYAQANRLDTRAAMAERMARGQQ